MIASSISCRSIEMSECAAPCTGGIEVILVDSVEAQPPASTVKEKKEILACITLMASFVINNCRFLQNS